MNMSNNNESNTCLFRFVVNSWYYVPKPICSLQPGYFLIFPNLCPSSATLFLWTSKTALKVAALKDQARRNRSGFGRT